MPLENLFDQNDVSRDPKMKPVDDVVEYRNIVTKENHKTLKKLACQRKRRLCQFDENIH